jgi:TM2 domain-containing membrane protein YozV
MFKIIGVDGRPYGPISASQLRAWIAENRVNAQTLMQPDGATEWKPMSAFPEFADAFTAKPPPPVLGSPQSQSDKASKKIVAGICGILLGGFGIHKFILGYTGAGLVMLLVSVLSCFIAAPVFHLIGLIEGIIYLTKTDEEFVRIYVDGRKEWF